MNNTLELRNIEDLLVKPPENVDVDFIYTNHDRDPAWFRFLKGAYDMPITALPYHYLGNTYMARFKPDKGLLWCARPKSVHFLREF